MNESTSEDLVLAEGRRTAGSEKLFEKGTCLRQIHHPSTIPPARDDATSELRVGPADHHSYGKSEADVIILDRAR